MEAHLLHIWPDLPDDWRARRFPSFRRLLLVVRWAPPTSAIATVLRNGRPHWWTDRDELLDDIRRDQLAIATCKSYPPPHHLSPEGRSAAVEAERRATRRRRRAEGFAAREAARQERLRKRREGSP